MKLQTCIRVAKLMEAGAVYLVNDKTFKIANHTISFDWVEETAEINWYAFINSPEFKNCLYGQINKRFDRRTDELYQLGYKYEFDKDLKQAFFVKRTYKIPASKVLYMEEWAWKDFFNNI